MLTIDLVKLGEAPWMSKAIDEMATGVRETPGIVATARILRYFTATGLRGTKAALSDETPWCSAFACWCMEQSGVKSTRSAAARSWLDWGQPLQLPKPGCVVVFDRHDSANPNAAHVAFYAGPNVDSTLLNVLGGNQRNSVCFAPYEKSRVIAYRWPVLA